MQMFIGAHTAIPYPWDLPPQLQSCRVARPWIDYRLSSVPFRVVELSLIYCPTLRGMIETDSSLQAT